MDYDMKPIENVMDDAINKLNKLVGVKKCCDYNQYVYDEVEKLTLCYFCGRSYAPIDEDDRIYRIKQRLKP